MYWQRGSDLKKVKELDSKYIRKWLTGNDLAYKQNAKPLLEMCCTKTSSDTLL